MCTCVFVRQYKSNLISQSDRVPPQRWGDGEGSAFGPAAWGKKEKKKWARPPHAFFTDAWMIIPICSH